MTLFTIGYEGLDIETFVSLLAERKIETVVDIRELPLSRKPGFSKRALAERLDHAGIAYVHKVELGCPKAVRDEYRNNGDWERYTKGFRKHLDTQRPAVRELSKLVAESDCVLLCFEADFSHCHRSMVAEAVHKHAGARVEHISTGDVRTAHPARRAAAFA